MSNPMRFGPFAFKHEWCRCGHCRCGHGSGFSGCEHCGCERYTWNDLPAPPANHTPSSKRRGGTIKEPSK